LAGKLEFPEKAMESLKGKERMLAGRWATKNKEVKVKPRGLKTHRRKKKKRPCQGLAALAGKIGGTGYQTQEETKSLALVGPGQERVKRLCVVENRWVRGAGKDWKKKKNQLPRKNRSREKEETRETGKK